MIHCIMNVASCGSALAHEFRSEKELQTEGYSMAERFFIALGKASTAIGINRENRLRKE